MIGFENRKLPAKILALSLLAAALSCSAVAQDPTIPLSFYFQSPDQQIPTPMCAPLRFPADIGFLCTPQQHAQWIKAITNWRTERLIRIGYDGSRYDVPELKWAQSAF